MMPDTSVGQKKTQKKKKYISETLSEIKPQIYLFRDPML